jgi:hypothetical protein
MKNQIKTVSFATLLSLLIISPTLLSVKYVSPVRAGNSGAIWTTTNQCGDPQNVNKYLVGDQVYINGNGFESNNYSWNIGKPGNSGSGVASGTFVVENVDGSFCFDAYTIQSSDSGVYQVKFGGVKGDNYRIIGVNIEEEPILGCTDPHAINFDPDATEDDQSCILPDENDEDADPTCNPGSSLVNGVCSHPQPQNGVSTGDSGQGGAESTPEAQGQVLGATTMADTGGALAGIFNALGALGTYLMGLAIKKKQ